MRVYQWGGMGAGGGKDRQGLCGSWLHPCPGVFSGTSIALGMLGGARVSLLQHSAGTPHASLLSPHSHCVLRASIRHF